MSSFPGTQHPMSANKDAFNRQVLRLAGAYLVVMMSALLALGWPLHENYLRSRVEVIEAREQGYLSMVDYMVHKEFLEMAGDLGVISNSAVLTEFLDRPQPVLRQRLALALEQVVHNYGRYIDLQVQDPQGRILVQVRRTQLLEQPPLPLDATDAVNTLRIHTPVFNSRRQQAGTVHLRFHLDELLDTFANVMARNPFHQAMLVGPDGQWLRSSQLQTDKPLSFAQQYPAVWAAMQRQHTGALQTHQGLFLFSTLYPLELPPSALPASAILQHQGITVAAQQPSQYHWQAVILVPRELLEESPWLWRSHGVVVGLLLFTLVFISWMLAERKVSTNVERAREQQNAQEIAALYDQAPCGYHSFDTHGRILRMNLTQLGWLGYSRHEVQNRLCLTDLLTPASAVHFKKLFPRLQVSGQLRDIALNMVRKDGSILPVLLNATAEMSPQGEFLFSRTVCIDMTEIQRLQQALERRANTDSLTGLCNRRHFFELGVRELSHATRQQRPVAVCMLDIDHFKQVNDTYGHAAGDTVLMALAHSLLQQLRDTDILARLGGEEFAILLPDTPLQAAQEIAERLRSKLAALSVPLDNQKPPLHFTVSIGVALRHSSNATLEDLLRSADVALYAAKTAGRNRVCVASPEPPEPGNS